MSERVRRILSRDCGPFWQFVKYGVVGVASTLVQVVAFYALASTALKCLKADDWAVRLLSLPAAEATDSVRAARFAIATAAGFLVSNVFCWLMNRWFVFTPGRFRWWKELALFVAVSGAAMALATAASWFLIERFGIMTTIAHALEIAVSFAFNYVLRKYAIFRS